MTFAAGLAMEFDRPRDRGLAQRNQPFLKLIAEHEQIAGDRIAHECRGKPSGVDDVRPPVNRLVESCKYNISAFDPKALLIGGIFEINYEPCDV